jgi:hypothetical protein
MTEELHSMQFYKTIVQSYADKNKDGKINTLEEQSIFDSYMKQFDINKDNKFDESDVEAYKQMVTLTEEERKVIEEEKKINSANSNTPTTKEELDKFMEHYNSDLITKKTDIKFFKLEVQHTLRYLYSIGEEKLADMYTKLFDKYCSENNYEVTQDSDID